MTTTTVERRRISGQGVPQVHSDYRFKCHLVYQDVDWRPERITLYQPGRATNAMMNRMDGSDLMRYALGGDHMVNAMACEYVERNPECFFADWRVRVCGNPAMGVHGLFRKVFFMGTLFDSPHGGDAVIGLFWDDEMERLRKIFRDLAQGFGPDCFVASDRHY